MLHTDQQTPARAASEPAVWHRDSEESRGVFGGGALAAGAVLTAMWPFSTVIAPGSWSFIVIAVVTVVAATGMLSRTLLRASAAWVQDAWTLLLQVVLAVATLTLLVAGDTALLGVIPTSATVMLFNSLGAAAIEVIAYGAAPLEPSLALAAVMGAGFALAAIFVDQLVVNRSAILPILLTGVIGAVPAIVTLDDINVAWFALFGVFALLIFRHTAQQHPESPRRSSVAVSLMVGAAAVVTTLVVAPALPLNATFAGSGVGVAVDASLRLGEDLRQPIPVEVLTVATEAQTAPYLRLTTLSRFDGSVWQPDEGELQSQRDGFGPPEWDEGVETKEQTTSIRVLRLSSSWLPVPYPATDIQGVAGSWRISPDNRTVFSRSADTVDNDYTVISERPVPTLEQIRAIDAAKPTVDPDDDKVELPAIISDLADDVTADASTDYDRLIALQDWFRSEFEYSLETPVEEDFDGTGAEAVAEFLEAQSGYCIHFAGAFALMAESLDMQVRIAVGYLPGSLTDEKRGKESVFSVSSDQLHSWPEVRFPGVGWVPFEPTATLGMPTAFDAAVTQNDSTNAPTTPTPTTAPQTEESTAPEVERDDAGSDSTGSDELQNLDPTPVGLITLGVVLLLLIPAFLRLAQHQIRLRRAQHGDAAAAWAELRDLLIDLKLPVSDADTPRTRAADLTKANSVDATSLRMLTDAVEQANYARDGDAESDLSEPLRAVLIQLRRSVDRPTRVRAALLPRSLYISRALLRVDGT